MKNTKISNQILVTILAFLYTVSTTSALLVSLLIPMELKTIILAGLISIIILSVMSINKKTFWITLALTGVAAIVFTAVVNKGGAVHIVQQTIYDYGKWVWQSITSLRRDTELFLRLSSILITLLVSIVCFFLIIRKIRILLLTLITLPVYIIPYLNQGVTGFTPMFISAIVLLVLFALSVFRKQGESFQKAEDSNLELQYLAFVIPLVLILAIGALGLSGMPRQDHSSRMDKMIRNVERQLEDWNIIIDKQFEFGGEFSLQSSGYQPGGNLGGNVTEKDGLSMMVETDMPVYLKGSIQDRYTGKSWTPGLRKATTIRSTNVANYVTDATFSERSVFNAAMKKLNYSLERADYDSFFKEGEVEIAHYGLKTNTLFYPENLIYVELAKQNEGKVRFNNNSELYFPFHLVEHTNYTVKFRYFITGNPYSVYLLQRLGKGVLDEWLAREENAPLKEKYEYIYERYTATENIPERVQDLAKKIVGDANAQNRYDMAKAIETYLKENYVYTLTPGNTPNSEDFTEYFLFKGKAGYCTYFATAMTVMLRSLGIPARYVEGFVTKEENLIGKTYSILQKNSHSWVEVFFEGVGWITFEPTPAIEGVVIPGEGTGEVVGPTDGYEDEIWDWVGGPPDEFFVEPDTSMWEDNNWDYDYKGQKKVKIPWMYILCAVAGFAVLFYPMKIIIIKIKLLVDRRKVPNRSIILYYQRILKLLDIAGMGLKPWETLYEMTDRKHIVIKSGSKELKKATEAFLSIRFADMKRDAKDFNNVHYVYKKMNENVKFFLGPWKFFVRRYIKGFKIW